MRLLMCNSCCPSGTLADECYPHSWFREERKRTLTDPEPGPQFGEKMKLGQEKSCWYDKCYFSADLYKRNYMQLTAAD